MSRTKFTAILMAVVMILSCSAVFAEDAAAAKTCTYVLYNVTGETITELYLTDNNSGEQSENFAGESGMANQTVIEVSGENHENYVVTLSFKTESGYEAAFTTLHFEDVPISLLPAPAEEAEEGTDATTGATPIAFAVPEFTAVYTLINQTGEKVTEVTLTENNSGTVLPIEFEAMEPDAELPLTVNWPADKTASEFELTLKFVTESGYEAAFTTLHFETVKINLLSTDAMTGPTPISFGF